MDVSKIEDKIDRVAAGATEVSMELGGVRVKDMSELFELAKMMAVSGSAVPYHLRGAPGTCLAVAIRALRFGFDPFTLAEHSYTMKKSVKNGNQWEEVETVAYDSFVIRAIIDAHANLTGKIRYTYEGEGDDTRCIARATPRGEAEALAHVSPTLGELKAARGRNDKGAIKGSPLWDSKPHQQLAYDTGRDFCRKFFPAVLLGWYDKDEFDENVTPPPAAAAPKIDGPGLRARLTRAKDSRGFDADGVHRTIDGEIARDAAASASVTNDETSRDGASLPQGASQAATTDPLPPSGDVVAADPSAATVVAEAATGDGQAAATASSSPEPPAPPTDGVGYPDYVRATMPFLLDEAAVSVWWKAGKKLRNSLPNFAGAVEEEAVAIKDARIAELKAAA